MVFTAASPDEIPLRRQHHRRHGRSSVAVGAGGQPVAAAPFQHPQSVHILQTQRLLLRHLEPGDLAALHALYRDPEVRRYFPDGTRTLDETREELEWFLDGHPRHPELGLWATVERASGAFLGRCGLLPWAIEGRLEVELAFLIDKTRWGEGLATEAALGIVEYARTTLGLSRLVCLVMPGNERSAAVARKVGMRFEREYTDEYGLCHLYAMALRSAGAATRE
jgi:ribosomal-protein-alanine N-acetyltransferase